MKKRIVALLLCCVMLLTLSPSLIASASADDENTVIEQTEPTEDKKDAGQVEEVKDEAKEEQKPADEPKGEESAFDVTTAKQVLFSAKSLEEAEAYFASLTEEQQNALSKVLTEGEVRAFAEKLGANVETEVITPPVNYTEVGPLMDAVNVNAPRRLARAINGQADEEQKDDGLNLKKTATFDSKTNTVTIRLEAYTTGKVTSSTQSVPVDVVLVLDESGSMTDTMQSFKKVYTLNKNKNYYVKSGNSYVQVSWCDGLIVSSHGAWCTGFHFIVHWGSEYEPMTSESDTTAGHVQFYEDIGSNQTKRAALISAATTFVNNVEQDARKNDVDHRISVIGFSNNSSIKIGLVDDIRNNSTDVKNAISGLNANGGTYIEKGMNDAKSVFDNAEATTATQRKRVVVVFTDGIPGSGTWNSTTINGSANPAINTAYDLKNTYGATVYTIGMLTDANPELEISDKDNNAARTNKFLHYVSSNYPNAKSMSNGGEGGNKGYYLSASDMESLNAIFTKISEEIATPAINLDGKAVVKDVISPYFAAPANATNIKVYTDKYNGTVFANQPEDVTNTIKPQLVGDTISVTGFDFNANFVSKEKKSDGTYGKKLIIEFTVQPKDRFLGGNNVPTNGTDSGIYKDGKPIKTFDVPAVNVPVADIEVSVNEKNVYLNHEMTENECLTGTTVTAKRGNTTVALNLSADNYGLESWQTKFVTITKEVTKPTGAMTADGSYTVTVKATPAAALETSEGEAAREKSDTKTGNINVFKPEVTFKDSQITLGEEANYAANYDSVVWKHGTTLSTAAGVTMIGTAPELTYTYAPTAGAFQQDTPVKVSAVKIGDTVVTSHVTFYREACSIKTDCLNTTVKVENGADNFIVHVKSLSLKISKTYDDNMLDPNQSAVFVVTGPNGTFTFEVVIHGMGSVTINGLPVGSYTVTEKNTWTWRYADTRSQTVTLAKNDTIETVSFTNTLNNPYWLTGGTWCDNRWIDGSKKVPTPASN